ncbi:sensor histidine kinase [Streptomyces sp. RPT161]|uniref:sensor histidine kinase n=1 Tax=Streptomyces sp. RPT161 TaxID=3015993 RepID=UPI0022B91BE7|nr:sensor histidine kinase [Streptomyces sp. RPT161]
MMQIPGVLVAYLTGAATAALGVAPFLIRSWLGRRAQVERSAAAEEENAHLTSLWQALEDEVGHLASARVPDLVMSLAHPRVPVRGLLDDRFAGTDIERALGSVLEQVREAVTKERLRVDSAARAAMQGTTSTIQAMLYQMQSALQQMQERYDDPYIAQDLLAADFLNEQTLRRVQATAVVCGAPWTGLIREDSYLADITVGARSRVRGYERVEVSNQLRDPVGVVARAVEPVAIAIAELLANALHHSHPDLPVQVALLQGHQGASVVIDDAGIGMHQEEFQRAERLMTARAPVLLTELGDPPRMGFPAIGQLAHQHGFAVRVEPSPYGGVRAIVYLPGALLTRMDPGSQPMSAMAPRPRSDTAPAPAPPPGGEGLPRRRRRQPTTAQARPRLVDTAPDRTPEEAGQRWAAFQAGTESGRAAAEPGSQQVEGDATS